MQSAQTNNKMSSIPRKMFLRNCFHLVVLGSYFTNFVLSAHLAVDAVETQTAFEQKAAKGLKLNAIKKNKRKNIIIQKLSGEKFEIPNISLDNTFYRLMNLIEEKTGVSPDQQQAAPTRQYPTWASLSQLLPLP